MVYWAVFCACMIVPLAIMFDKIKENKDGKEE